MIDDPLRSVHTSNLPDLLGHVGVSLVVSTYQAGRVVLVRKDGAQVNTHFRNYQRPMGVAGDHNQLAIGTKNEVWTLRNMPAVGRKLEPPGKHDACFIPRQVHVTGHVDIHEMEYDQNGQLWLVNTLFSCLCTLDVEHSFHPRWRPHFVSAYTPEDRCHLNGLAMVDGRPKYVTALGETDTAGGWRANKPSGGILMDVESGEVLLRGLSMPHSPRWHEGALWFLESGRGSLARVDLQKGTWSTVAELPGFTRGLEFAGPLAFIGLSQVRESAVFGGIPLVERVSGRNCGVWVVDTRTGQTVGFLRFESGVQEIFAVKVLPGIRFPEMLDWGDERLGNSYVLPDQALALVPPERREGADSRQEVPPRPGFAPSADPFARAYNRGILLRDSGKFEEAAEAFREALEVSPENADAYNDLANAQHALNDLPGAVETYRKAIERRPDFAVAHMNLGMTLLKLGDFPGGFAEFNWRWDTPGFLPLSAPQPQWDGSDLTGKRILVHTEQGAGDVIQFIRFLPQVAAQAERVILVAPQPLLRLLQTAEGFDELRGAASIDLSAFDVHAPMMSLPLHLGITLKTVPAVVPYLAPSAQRKPLPEPAQDRPLQVGLVWAGSPTQGNDAYRSMPSRLLTPLLEVPGVTFYSLQVGPKADLIQAIWGRPAPVHNLAPTLVDWAATADAVAQLDLVIGVDTGVMHLTGALGKPAWVLLGVNSDWRWLQDREDTPWYPTLRLFRQMVQGDWESVVGRVRGELEELASRHLFLPKNVISRADR